MKQNGEVLGGVPLGENNLREFIAECSSVFTPPSPYSEPEHAHLCTFGCIKKNPKNRNPPCVKKPWVKKKNMQRNKMAKERFIGSQLSYYDLRDFWSVQLIWSLCLFFPLGINVLVYRIIIVLVTNCLFVRVNLFWLAVLLTRNLIKTKLLHSTKWRRPPRCQI